MKETMVIILVLVAVAAGIYFWTRGNGTVLTPVNNNNPGEEMVFCTADAMLCPDGSYVGRVPPTCEFAACPIPEEESATTTSTTTPTTPTTTDSVM